MLSSKTVELIEVAMGDQLKANELVAAINASSALSPAADVAANSPAGAVSIALSTSDTYTDAAVNTAVNGALTSVIADLNSSRTQINEILSALKAAGLMS